MNFENFHFLNLEDFQNECNIQTSCLAIAASFEVQFLTFHCSLVQMDGTVCILTHVDVLQSHVFLFNSSCFTENDLWQFQETKFVKSLSFIKTHEYDQTCSGVLVVYLYITSLRDV